MTELRIAFVPPEQPERLRHDIHHVRVGIRGDQKISLDPRF